MNRKSISLIVLVISIILATGVTSIAAKGNMYRPQIVDKKKASPGDSSKKTESKSTEATTATIPLLPEVDMAALSAITEEYSKTMQEKIALQEKLNMLMENQNDFISRLHEIDDMIIEYQDKIDDIEAKTVQAQNDMAILEESIAKAEQLQQDQYDQLKEHIQQEYENGEYTYLDALFNSVDYIDVVNKAEYIQAVDSYNNNILGQLTASKNLLEDKKAMLEMVNEEMAVLEQGYVDEQESLELLSQEKEKQISQFQNSIDVAKGEMATIEALEAQQSAQIAALEAQYNVSISINGGTTAIEYNGADFLWPMPTSTRISSYFGRRVAPTKGATSYHKGIDIPCPVGSAVIAAASGRVIYVGYLGSAGNAVVIDHGSGISTCYYHLSAFGVKVGDNVSAGQTICYSGNTGVSTGPHLHFSVRVNGEYVNPLNYYKNVKDKGST